MYVYDITGKFIVFFALMYVTKEWTRHRSNVHSVTVKLGRILSLGRNEDMPRSTIFYRHLLPRIIQLSKGYTPTKH